MKIGYARVSTDEQNTDLQLAALKRARVKKIFEDKISGAAVKRPGLDKCLKTIKTGDVLVVWKLDRLGRSLPHLVGILADLKQKGIGFKSLTEAIDTESAAGRLLGHMIAALAEFERSLITERTRAGVKAAKLRGVKLGRSFSLTPAQVQHARKLIEQGERPAAVAKSLKVGRSTLYRYL
jgi:DNA invertase Pin-like site-specific DNA recombinase